MKIISILRKYVGTAFAFAALVVAQVASTQFSYIYYQDTVPEKVKALSK
jgi:cyclic lactone autoinducer peptide